MPVLGAVVAGLGAAAAWGAGDFAGGLAARRASVWRVLLISQPISLDLTLAATLVAREGAASAADLAWGAAAGLAGAVGVTALYAALSLGTMGVAAPLTGVVTAAIPIGVGFALEGAPPLLALAGFALAIPGVWLLAGGEGAASRQALGLALLAGVGFGAFLVAADRISPASTWWPLFAARAASTAGLLLVILSFRLGRGDPRPVPLGWAALAGTGDALGNLGFILAARWGRLDVAAVLSSLYPAMTVILASLVLRERLTRRHVAGMALTLVAIVLIAAG